MAFIESNIEEDCFEDRILNFFSTQYLLNASKKDVKTKIFFLFNTHGIGSTHCFFYSNFESFYSVFNNLNDSDKKEFGFVITHEECGRKPIHYLRTMSRCFRESGKKYCDYFKEHLDQVFIIPEASDEMDGKSFDFEDKYKLVDFIKRDQKNSPKIEIPLSSDVKQILTLLQDSYE